VDRAQDVRQEAVPATGRQREEEEEVTPFVYENKNYGDQKAIDDLKRQASGLKQGMADDVPTIRRERGRPAGPRPVNVPPQEEFAIPEEHRAAMEDFARSLRAAAVFRAIAADPAAGPWARMYARFADENAAEKAKRVKEITPDFEV